MYNSRNEWADAERRKWRNESVIGYYSFAKKGEMSSCLFMRNRRLWMEIIKLHPNALTVSIWSAAIGNIVLASTPSRLPIPIFRNPSRGNFFRSFVHLDAVSASHYRVFHRRAHHNLFIVNGWSSAATLSWIDLYTLDEVLARFFVSILVQFFSFAIAFVISICSDIVQCLIEFV